MGVVRAKIQTVEDIYQLLRMAVVGRRPIRAAYDGWDRGSARTGWAGITKGNFECCAISAVDRVAAGCKRPARRLTGVVSR